MFSLCAEFVRITYCYAIPYVLTFYDKALHCMVLYCMVLYGIVLYCVAFFVLYCIALHVLWLFNPVTSFHVM